MSFKNLKYNFADLSSVYYSKIINIFMIFLDNTTLIGTSIYYDNKVKI